jgi:hypothetical protein
MRVSVTVYAARRRSEISSAILQHHAAMIEDAHQTHLLDSGARPPDDGQSGFVVGKQKSIQRKGENLWQSLR